MPREVLKWQDFLPSVLSGETQAGAHGFRGSQKCKSAKQRFDCYVPLEFNI